MLTVVPAGHPRCAFRGHRKFGLQGLACRVFSQFLAFILSHFDFLLFPFLAGFFASPILGPDPTPPSFVAVVDALRACRLSTSRRESAPSASMSSTCVRRRCSPHRPPLVLPQARLSRRGGLALVLGRRRRSKRKQKEKRALCISHSCDNPQLSVTPYPPWPPRHEACFLLPSVCHPLSSTCITNS